MKCIRYVVMCCSLVSSACAQLREVTFNIQLRDPTGQPIAAAPVEQITPRGIAFGFTDAQGNLQLIVPADHSDSVAVATLSDGYGTGASLEQRIAAKERLQELRHQYSWNVAYRISLEAGVNEYMVEIVALSTFTLTGRLVDAAQQPVNGSIGAIQKYAHARVASDDVGAFAIRGLGMGQLGQLVIQLERSGQIHFVTLDPSQTGGDLDIGDVTVTDAPADARIALTMTNTTGVRDSTLAFLGTGVTLVSTTGQEVFCFPADQFGNVLRWRQRVPPERPLVPAGEYFVVPGYVAARGGLGLYRSVAAGRQPQLEAAGVPKVTAVPGGEVSLEFDARTAYDAVISVGGDLAD